ncbi:MAG: hypothetical protein JWO43_316 [Candidatus Adlerbacteria bacterium]|nr:hypothetical protein [Candidatus Adlerbacteria bacterium]
MIKKFSVIFAFVSLFFLQAPTPVAFAQSANCPYGQIDQYDAMGTPTGGCDPAPNSDTNPPVVETTSSGSGSAGTSDSASASFTPSNTSSSAAGESTNGGFGGASSGSVSPSGVNATGNASFNTGASSAASGATTVDAQAVNGKLNYTPLEPLPGFPTNVSDPNNLNDVISAFFKLALGFGAMFAVLLLVLGGISYMTTEAVGQRVAAKQRITAALLGMLLLLCSYLILYTINPNLLNFNLKLQQSTITGSSPVTSMFGAKNCIGDSCITQQERDANALIEDAKAGKDVDSAQLDQAKEIKAGEQVNQVTSCRNLGGTFSNNINFGSGGKPPTCDSGSAQSDMSLGAYTKCENIPSGGYCVHN